jgi:DNA primase
LKVGSDEAKYVNSPETLVFHKSDVLFGIHHAKNSIQKEKKVIIVEGQMDVITLHQHGITNVV